MNSKILNKYTPLSIKELLIFMENNKDLYIIIDTKENEYNNYNELDVYKTLVKEVNKYDKKLLKRFIIQLYNFKDYKSINKIYPFKNYILTLYKLSEINIYQITYYSLINNIDVITIPTWYLEEGIVKESDIKFIKSKNIKVYIHTINNYDEYDRLLKMGVDGVYTDFLN